MYDLLANHTEIAATYYIVAAVAFCYAVNRLINVF